jgi:hypothetical protein
VLAIPAGFLARDQISHGFLKGEPAIAFALFVTALAFLMAFGDRPGGLTFGSIPVGILLALALTGMILRRTACSMERPGISHHAILGAS